MRKPEEVRFQRTLFLTMAIVVVVILLVVSISYVMFFKQRLCTDIGCFQKASADCVRFEYTNEDSVATWKYEILGKEGDNCRIRVTLLSAKQGELGINSLINENMICYTQGTISYPEKDLNSCHGILKEDLLNIIITKLHTYVINNVGKLDESLKSFG